MATTHNLKGTSFASFTVGKKGRTIYQGDSTPSGGIGQAGDIFLLANGDNSDILLRLNSGWVSIAGTIEASGVEFDTTNTNIITGTNTQAALEDLDEYLNNLNNSYTTMPIGVPFPVLRHLAGVNPPSNAGDAKFIMLSANQTGAGKYNDGLLTSESVTGSAPLLVVTAVIDYAGSPAYGETVHLINTESRYLMPSTGSGGVANDQMQVITGQVDRVYANLAPTSSGAFSITTYNSNVGEIGNYFSTQIINFNSANSPSARTGDHTNVKRMAATFYMRIA